MEKVCMARSYGTMEPEYVSDRLSPATVKGKKQELVAGLRSKLNEQQAKLAELKKQRESLQEKGRDLDEQDLKRMKRLENIVVDLKQTIDKQVKMFNLKVR